MKFILRLLLLLLLEAFPALAATSTLTGTFVDASGNPVNGYLILQLPVPAVDTATGNSIAVTPVRYRVVNGIVQSGPPVYDVAGLQPQNLYYITSLYDNSGTRIFTANYFVTGTPFNLSAAIPTNITTSNISFAAGNLISVSGNNTFTGNNSFKNLNNRCFADQQAGVDMAAKINACWASLPSTGGIVDATGFQGVQACGSDMNFGVTKQGVILIGAATMRCTVQQTLPNSVDLKGINQLVSVIQADPTFPINTALIVAKGAQSQEIDHIGVDCNNVAGATGIFATDWNEKAGMHYGKVYNCAAFGINVDASAFLIIPAQKYVLHDIECYPGTAGSAATTCIHLKGNGGGGPELVQAVSANGNVGNPIGNSFLVENFNQGVFIGLHAEQSTNGFATVNSASCVSFITVIGLDAGAAVTGGQNLINIPASCTGNDYRFFNVVKNGATNILNDVPRSFTLTDATLDYSVGPGALGSQQIWSTSPNVGKAIASGSTFLGGVSLKGGVINSIGVQLFNTTTTCTTAATINTPCTTASITLPVAYADTNYRLSVMCLGVTAFPQVQTVTKSNTTFTITLNNLTAAAATCSSFDVSAVHN